MTPTSQPPTSWWTFVLLSVLELCTAVALLLRAGLDRGARRGLGVLALAAAVPLSLLAFIALFVLLLPSGTG